MAANGGGALDLALITRLRGGSRMAAWFAVVIAGGVLVGWTLGLEQIRVMRSPLEAMKFNTALVIAALGGGLLLHHHGRHVQGRVAIGIAVVITSAVFVETITGTDLGIDELVVRDPGALGPPGRAPLVRSVTLTVCCVAAFLQCLRPGARAVGSWLAVAALVSSMFSLAGYAFSVTSFNPTPAPATSIHSELAVGALALAILLAWPDRGGMAVFVSDTLGGALARRLLPLCVAVTLGLGWLRVVGEAAGLYGPVAGVALYAGANVATILLLIWAAATRLARADLERQEAIGELQELIETTPDGMLIHDRRAIRFVNPALTSMLGVPREHLVGLAPFSLFVAADRDRIEDGLAAPSNGIWLRARAARADGSTRLLDVTRLRDVHFGGDGCALIAVRDVTDRVALDAQLSATDRLATIGLLAAGIGHEINNPLAGLMIQLELLSREDHEDSREALADAQLCAVRIRDVVADLRMLARPDDDRQRTIRLETVLDSTMRIVGTHLHRRAMVKLDYGRVPEVVANEARLSQVVINLVMNAGQAIPEGDPSNQQVRVGLSTDDAGWAVIEVADTGSGLPPEVRARLFEPFFTTKPTGTGLGLYLSQRIVQSFGGAMEVESEPGAGTTFRVRLPPAPPAPPATSAVTA